MKPALVLAALALLCLCVQACGGSRSPSRSGQGARAEAARSSNRLLGDDDDDETGEMDGGYRDEFDSDFDHDRRDLEKGYYDADDGAIRAYGHAAGAGTARVLSAIVKRYYRAAAAGDGVDACSLLERELAQTTAQAAANPADPSYLRGADSCQAVASLLLKHRPGGIDGAIVVTAVRIDGARADVLLGSRTMPAAYIELQREAGAWRIDELLGSPLP